jgi:hypothetical protein
MTDSWTVKAYTFNDGNYEMVEWASGFAYKQADTYFKSLYDSNAFAKLEMTKSVVVK